MKLAVDVHYRGAGAAAAGVLFQGWDSGLVEDEIVVTLNDVMAYVPGSFYLRELPCIQQLLQRINTTLDHIVIDGYVFLGSEQRPGLGKHLYDSIGGESAVIGVAKNAYKDTPSDSELYRGRSRRPLYITAAGVPTEVAKSYLRSMHGRHRIPTILRRADQLCRALEGSS